MVSSSGSSNLDKKIAMSLLVGFAFMFFVEQLSSGHAHGHSHKHQHSPLPTTASLEAVHPFQDGHPSPGNGASKLSASEEEFDMSLSELENAEGSGSASNPGIGHSVSRTDGQAKGERAQAFPLTLGLVIHSLADGLALGASALPRGAEGEEADTGSSSSGLQLSFLVFLALIVHKGEQFVIFFGEELSIIILCEMHPAPTALALSMSLLSKSLSPSECRRHLAVFSVSTPLSALASFGILSLLGGGVGGGDWTGIALLVSVGFLVLQHFIRD